MQVDQAFKTATTFGNAPTVDGWYAVFMQVLARSAGVMWREPGGHAAKLWGTMSMIKFVSIDHGCSVAFRMMFDQ